MRVDRSATLVCEDRDDDVVYTKETRLTDFPLDTISLWFADNVIYLPSEH